MRRFTVFFLLMGQLACSRGGAGVIQHIVVIDEENHSFDDIFGKFCAEQAANPPLIVREGLNQPCDGATTATMRDGSTRALTTEPDFGLKIAHDVPAQRKAINGGKMNKFDKIKGCTPSSSPAYGCLSQFDPLRGTCGIDGTANCLPNIDNLAENFAMSDRTFEFRQTPSWAGHMILASATIQHFEGQIPAVRPGDPGGASGWGCDSGKSTQWYLSGNSGTTAFIPSCVPDQTGSLGPTWAGYTGTTAQYVPTLFDRMDAKGVTWKIYWSPGQNLAAVDQARGWTICPSFWECLGSSQANNVVDNSTFSSDASAGVLPSVSFLIPSPAQSAHQPGQVSGGDNWVGQMVSSVMGSPEWSSTAIFITYDDCGCFYDHVNPLQYSPEWGVRVPMLIVSPYARAGYTDSTPATFVSMLAFIEHTFELSPLNPCATVDAWDSNCTDDVGSANGPTYDYSGAFNFSQPPLAPLTVVHTSMNAGEAVWIRAHPEAGNEAT